MPEQWPVREVDSLSEATWTRLEDAVVGRAAAHKPVPRLPGSERPTPRAWGLAGLAAVAAAALVFTWDHVSAQPSGSHVVTAEHATELIVARSEVVVGPHSSMYVLAEARAPLFVVEHGIIDWRSQDRVVEVHAGPARIIAEGTAFSVERDRDDVRVSVIKGRLTVEVDGVRHEMGAGDIWPTAISQRSDAAARPGPG